MKRLVAVRSKCAICGTGFGSLLLFGIRIWEILCRLCRCRLSSASLLALLGKSTLLMEIFERFAL